MKQNNYKIDSDKLYGTIVSAGYCKADVADYLEMSHRTFYHKMKIGKFGSDEIAGMIDFLHIKEPSSIFFPNLVT